MLLLQTDTWQLCFERSLVTCLLYHELVNIQFQIPWNFSNCSGENLTLQELKMTRCHIINQLLFLQRQNGTEGDSYEQCTEEAGRERKKPFDHKKKIVLEVEVHTFKVAKFGKTLRYMNRINLFPSFFKEQQLFSN